MTGEQNNKFSLSLIRLRAAFAVVTVWTAFTFPRVESGVDRRRGGERKWSPLSRERVMRDTRAGSLQHQIKDRDSQGRPEDPERVSRSCSHVRLYARIRKTRGL